MACEMRTHGADEHADDTRVQMSPPRAEISQERETMNSKKNQGAKKVINKYLPRLLVGAVIGLGIAGAFVSTGCNTVHGAGEDLERGGEKLQGTSERHGANP
jgi:predicted small secreted protein